MARNFTMDDVPVLYEDNQILVVVKPQNMPTQADSSGDKDLLTLLKEYIKVKYDKPGEAFLGLVHRLDRPTGGVMVFARNSKSAGRLCESIITDETEKKYLAVLNGCPKEKRGQLITWLKKNPLTNSVYVATSATEGAKRAELEYKIIEDLGVISLAKIRLETGRSHQIRVQFSSINNPVFGDVRYHGDILAKGHNLALWAYELAFNHPTTKEKMVFQCYPPEIEPWTRFDIEKHLNYFNNNDD